MISSSVGRVPSWYQSEHAQVDSYPERNLAISVIRQAVHDFVKDPDLEGMHFLMGKSDMSPLWFDLAGIPYFTESTIYRVLGRGL